MRLLSLLILGFLIIPPGFSQEAAVPTSVYYERKSDLFRFLPNGPDEIILLGNSITDGGNWFELLRDPRIKNRGISADVTRGILNRADEVLESKPLKIFLLIGINDLAKGASQENILDNIGTFVKRVKSESPRTQTYIQSILPVNPDYTSYPKHVSKGEAIVELNKKIALLCQDMDVEYLNLYPYFITQDGVLNPEYTNDGLHLSGSGYIVWSEILKPYLKD
ncbi:MAG: sialate O-acetylesterase [Candidatus Marinimicrobia bacterium]|nr:sialate O-acetylesterase [Candidatus Neomarinimicrobiota bacterium]MBT4361732.1 sialate O-acetylesterase [Candidatus Neomarinimicrobiota bacterium]MBT4715876.1 sialate O-acetylesterase [Candidatus Neomarinimicrobiota bacterium]MBT4947783.1 sialate O-acetylesterase [Candidatus Neomarinimicrobiota bacterium]MBT5271270.1 sialate O-acetylesterase [Candidatus Neomarinimicrobiota bacterium]